MEAITAIMTIFRQIWEKLDTLYVPGAPSVSFQNLLLTVGFIGIAIAIFNRLTGTEGMGTASSLTDSMGVAARNAGLRKKERDSIRNMKVMNPGNGKGMVKK